jgi:predicted permease
VSIRVLVRRQRPLIAFVWLSLACGLAVALAAFGLVAFRLEPAGLTSLIRAVAIPAIEWTRPWTDDLVTPAQSQASSVAALVGVLLALAGVSALVATVNVLSMVAGRRIARRREFAIRAAIGAGPWRFLADRLKESALLYGGGLLLAVLAALAIAAGMRAAWPAGLEPPGAAGNGGVILFVLIGALFVLASFAGRVRLSDLRGRLAGGSATADPTIRRQHATAVIVATTLALALSCTAALLLRHDRSEPVDSGIRSAGFATMDVTSRVAAAGERAALWETVVDRVRELPGITAESLSTPGAWLGLGMRDQLMVECGECFRAMMYMPIQPAFAHYHAVSPGFFETLGVEVIAGRSFDRSDTFDTARVAIVNETFARRNFENGDPIGHWVQIGGMDGEHYTVIGVVRDIRGRGLGAPRLALPAVYFSAMQEPPATLGLTVRTDLEPAAVAERVQQVTRDLPIAAAGDAAALSDRLDAAVAPLRWFGALFAIIAGAAVGLALHGVNALVRAHVRARRKELGIRAAIGATPLRLIGMVLGETLRIAGIGLALGSVAAWSAGRALQLEIAGVPPLDFPTALPLAAAILLAAMAGAFAPALRAARSSPAHVFRSE